MNIIELIQKKRDGLFLTKDEIHFIIKAYINNSIKDYHMSAWLMAVCINGMSEDEISYLTQSMLYSGEVISHHSKDRPLIDKHSTGGVGDKISIPLAPAVASLGVKIPMIAGRGLGHTGGTLDKLESIPGFRCGLLAQEYKDQVEKIGCVIMGQTTTIAPADKRIYALRDVTGTVESISLISSSIMSKKLAEGIDGLVLDVKFGSGAFMKDFSKAKLLASTMVNIGKNMGKKVTALMTNMNEPLGQMVGHSLEILECIDILKGQGPKDSLKLTIELGAEMLLMASYVESLEEGRKQIIKSLNTGIAFNKFREMVIAQGGDISYIDNPKKFVIGPFLEEIKANKSGYLFSIDNHNIGMALGLLGGGREQITDTIDPRVGFKMHVKIGDKIEKNQPLCTIFHADKNLLKVKEKINNALVIREEEPVITKLFADRISTLYKD